MTPWKWYVYIIECEDNSYYTGLTWDVAKRFEQHKNGNGCKYTKKHGVKKVVYYEEYEDLDVARRREKQVQNWNREKRRI